MTKPTRFRQRTPTNRQPIEMKKRERLKYCKQLIADLQADGSYSGELHILDTAVIKIIRHGEFLAIVGTDIEGSSFDATVLTAALFVQILTEPSEFMHFSMGKDIGRWDSEEIPEGMKKIKEQTALLLNSVNTFLDIPKVIENRIIHFGVAETVRNYTWACFYLSVADKRMARHYLEWMESCTPMFANDMHKKNCAAELLALLEADDWKSINRILLANQAFTIEHIKLKL